MMAKISWYKRDPNAALEGMMELSLEERGAYNTILDLIYTKSGCVIDDDRFLSGWMRCDLRVWRRIKERLIILKKVYIADGKIRNYRADVVILEALDRVASAKEAGLASAAKREVKSNENNNLVSTPVERTPQLTTPRVRIRDTKKDNNNTSLELPLEKTREVAIGSEDLFERFWEMYPRQRRGNKNDAMRAWVKALKEKRSTPEEIINGVSRYAQSDEVNRGYAAGAPVWLNRDGWANDYKSGGSARNHEKPSNWDKTENAVKIALANIRAEEIQLDADNQIPAIGWEGGDFGE